MGRRHCDQRLSGRVRTTFLVLMVLPFWVSYLMRILAWVNLLQNDGLVNRVLPDHELFDEALAWARKFAGQAPVALEQIKQISHGADLDEGIEAEKEGFATAFASEDAREGISAFLGKRSPKWQGR